MLYRTYQKTNCQFMKYNSFCLNQLHSLTQPQIRPSSYLNTSHLSHLHDLNGRQLACFDMTTLQRKMTDYSEPLLQIMKNRNTIQSRYLPKALLICLLVVHYTLHNRKHTRSSKLFRYKMNTLSMLQESKCTRCNLLPRHLAHTN